MRIAMLLLIGLIIGVGIFVGLTELFDYLRPDIGTSWKAPAEAYNSVLPMFSVADSYIPFIVKTTFPILSSLTFLVLYYKAIFFIREKK